MPVYCISVVALLSYRIPPNLTAAFTTGERQIKSQELQTKEEEISTKKRMVHTPLRYSRVQYNLTRCMLLRFQKIFVQQYRIDGGRVHGRSVTARSTLLPRQQQREKYQKNTEHFFLSTHPTCIYSYLPTTM